MKKKWAGILGGVLLAASTLPASAALTDGLVGYWNFDSCDTTDSSGNGNNGTIHGSPVCVDRDGKKAYRFNGSSDYITVPNSSSFPSSAITFSYWVNREGKELSGRWENYLSKEWAFQSYAETGSSNCTNCFSAGFYQGTPGYWTGYYSGANSLSLSGWVLYSFTFDNATQTGSVYINGALVRSFTETDQNSRLRVSTQPLYIGRNGSANVYYINGLLDDVRIYNRALSANEIQQLYSGNSCPSVDTTSAYNQGYSAAQAACKANPSSCALPYSSSSPTTTSGHSTYNPTTNVVHVPFLDVPTIFGGASTVYETDWTLMPNTNPIQLHLKNAKTVP